MTGDDVLAALDPKARRAVNANANGSTNEHRERSLVVRTLVDVEPEEIRWLWAGRIPRGKVTLLVGDPGSGKSFASLAISAALTHGRPLPGDNEGGEPTSVIVWNGEDGIADTIRVRAELCGAKLDRVHVVEATLDEGGSPVPFGLKDLRLLAEEIERRGDVGMVVIDPIAALLGGVDAHRDVEVRAALQPLAELATLSGVAVVVGMHLRKSEAARSLYRVGGSIGFVGIARSVLLVAKDEATGRSAIVPLKQNLAGEVEPIEFQIDADGFWWRGEASELSASRLLSAATGANDRSAIERAKDGIRVALTDGTLDATELERIVLGTGVSKKTFERARGDLHTGKELVRSGGGKYGPVRWTLKGSLAHDSLSRSNGQDDRDDDSMSERTRSANGALSSNEVPAVVAETALTARTLTLGSVLCGVCRHLDRGYDDGRGGYVCGQCA
jgi:hypothetical protein